MELCIRNIKVLCPADKSLVKTMELYFTRFPDGVYFAFPCEGCGDAGGTSYCNMCRKAIPSMLYYNPKFFYTDDIIELDLENYPKVLQ